MQRAKQVNGVVGGVLILTTASLLVKAIGVFYKIPLSHVLGDEGMGYFNAAYTIYAWLYMLSTAGIPVALSILISESRVLRDETYTKRVMRVAGTILVTLGALGTVLLLFGADKIALFLGTEGASYTIRAIAPSLLLVSVSSLFRGYFQGYQNMLPTALSQLAEAVGKVAFGILLASYAMRRGYALSHVSAFAVMGVTLGSALSVFCLMIHYVISERKEHIPDATVERHDAGVTNKTLFRRFFMIALPVTISASVMSLTGLIDLGMIIRRLVALGYTQAEATALYGNYTTLVVPVFNLPGVLIAPIATGIIPALSAAFSAQNREERERLICGAFRSVAIIAVPCAVGLGVFARPILGLLYPADSVDVAYRLLIYISPAVIFLCLLTVANASLQACSAPRVPMVAMLVGGALKIVAGYILLAKIGIAGSALGTLICYAFALGIDVLMIGRKINYLPSLKSLIVLPLFSSVISIGVSGVVYYFLLVDIAPKIGVLFCIALSAVLYIGVSFATGNASKKELLGMIKNRCSV